MLLLVYILTVWATSRTLIDVQPFSQPVGPAQPISSDPAELFRLFFTDDIVHNIVVEMIRYAAQCLKGKHGQHQRRRYGHTSGFTYSWGW